MQAPRVTLGVIPAIITIVLEVLLVWLKVNDVFAYFCPLFFVLAGYGIVSAKVEHEFMQQFAAANGFSYSLKGSAAGLDGSLLRIGRDGSVSNMVSGQFQNHPISLFIYKYVTGYGRSQDPILTPFMSCSSTSRCRTCYLKGLAIISANI